MGTTASCPLDWAKIVIKIEVVDDFILHVDDRLIHGQVTAGWVRPLGIEWIVLVNDEVATDEWEQEIYTLAVPTGVKTVILSVAEGIEFLRNTADKKKTMVVVASLKDAVEIIEGGVMIKKITIGGLHFEPGRRCIAPYLCFNGTDEEYLKKVVERGIKVEGREIPGGPSLDVWSVFKKAQQK